MSCPASQTHVRSPVCPAQASQTVKKSFFWGEEEGKGDGLKWCPHKVISAHMLGHVHGGQPTVILSVSASFCVNAWICAARSTDRDPDFCVNAWTCPRRATDRDLQSASAIEKKGECLDGYVHLEQPTMILQMSFSINSVTYLVMSVMSVIFLRTVLFSN